MTSTFSSHCCHSSARGGPARLIGFDAAPRAGTSTRAASPEALPAPPLLLLLAAPLPVLLPFGRPLGRPVPADFDGFGLGFGLGFGITASAELLDLGSGVVPFSAGVVPLSFGGVGSCSMIVGWLLMVGVLLLLRYCGGGVVRVRFGMVCGFLCLLGTLGGHCGAHHCDLCGFRCLGGCAHRNLRGIGSGVPRRVVVHTGSTRAGSAVPASPM